MARLESPIDSPLSSMADSSSASDDDSHDVPIPPAKRQKIGDGSAASSTAPVLPDHDIPIGDFSDVSSDTSGEVPNSPGGGGGGGSRFDDDDNQEQVTACAWESCKAGEFDNMDRLVAHIHNDHIEGKQKKYTCEWVGCQRKSMPHASGYALKAHMRSHTREKPFYCYLPECERSFTRSDALAKHMRTVHETEALRPSDPVPKSMQASSSKTGKPMKIILRTPQSHAAGRDDVLDNDDEDGRGGNPWTVLSEDQGFSSEELRMPLQRLWGLCRMQVKWAEEEGEWLHNEIGEAEAAYKKAWLEKEILLHQVIQNEMSWHERRKAVISGAADVNLAGASPYPDVAPDAVADGAAQAASASDDEEGSRRDSAAAVRTLAVEESMD